MKIISFCIVVLCGIVYNKYEVFIMRVNIVKSKNAEQVYIINSYRKNGKSTSAIYKKLGNMNSLIEKYGSRDKVLEYANSLAKEETLKFKDLTSKVNIELSPTIRIDKDKERSFNVGYLFLQDILYDLRIDNITRNIKTRHDYKYDLNNILSDLVYTWILYPSSKKKSYELANKFIDTPKYELFDVYRALKVLAKESDYIQTELYRNSNFLVKRDVSTLYYDCTNYYFEIEIEDDFRKYGKSKEHRPLPIVTMGLFMDKDGIPLAYDLLEGNKNEQTSLKPLERKIINDFDINNFIYCSDAGLASKSNKLFNSIGNRKYVITQSLKKLNKENKEIALSPKNFKVLGSDKLIDISKLDENDKKVFNTIYYKEIPNESTYLDETIIVTYSPKYKAYQRKIRETQILRAKELIKSETKLKRGTSNPNDIKRFIKKTSLTDNGELASDYYELDEDKILEEARYDGYYAVSTNIEDDISEIIKINTNRWQIEECFRIMKTEFKARPVYLSKTDSIKAHFLTCFIALLVYRILEKKLDNKYTVTEILDTLKSMDTTLLDKYGYIPSYKRTNITDDLHNIFNFNTDYEIITKKSMRSLISKTKNNK